MSPAVMGRLTAVVCLLYASSCMVEASDREFEAIEHNGGGQTDPSCVGADGFDPPVIPQAELGNILGVVPALQADLSQLYTGPWTNWYHDSMELGLAKLAVMRGILELIGLHDPHLPGARVGNLDPSVECPPETDGVRTIDGFCNDQDDPMMGAAGARFGRNVPLPYGHPDPSMLLDPNPRTVSLKLLRRPIGGFKPVPFLNMLAAAWVQFQVHDWFSHGDNDPTGTIDVPLSRFDPLRIRFGMRTMKVQRTTDDPTRLPEEAAFPPTYQNEVTHWWDASQVYGSDYATSNRLRTFSGGKLKVDNKGLLPKADGFTDTGFRRNWWLGLEMLHTLFALEHNAIADMLAVNNPGWSDQKLFDTARMINAAVITKIHTLEWTPAILPNPTLEAGMNANWYGLNKFLDPPFPFRGPDPVVFGIVGNQKNLHGVPYSLTEEFVSVYRMHPLLPEALVLRRASNGRFRGLVSTESTRDAGARRIAERVPMGDLMYSFGVSHPGALVLDNYPRFLQDLVTPAGVIDMGTIDILRDRERGVPRYNNVRRLLALKPLANFEELTDDPKLLAKLKDVYDDDIEKLDLMVGTFAESTRPSCYGFGETLFQVFTVMATRRIQADRFYTTDYNASVYTQEGLNWVEASSMKNVLLRHFPNLGDTGLNDVANAFYPWDEPADGYDGGDGDDDDDDDD